MISIAHFSPLTSVVIGILILIFPKALLYLIALYLILTGLVGLGLIHL